MRLVVGACIPAPHSESEIDPTSPGEKWDADRRLQSRLHPIGTSLCGQCGLLFKGAFSTCPALLSLAVEMWDCLPERRKPIGAFLARNKSTFLDYVDVVLSDGEAHALHARRLREIAEELELTRLSNDELDQLWSELGSEDANIFFRAYIALAAAEKESIPYLKKHLRPRAPESPERVRQLIKHLKGTDEKARRIAKRELAKLDDLAVSPLLEVLGGGPSEAVRRTAEEMLAKIPVTYGLFTKVPPQQLRTLHAIKVLERIASNAAQAILRDLAKGAPGARETIDAAGALERLKK
jgi:hypothetical protein